MDVTAKRALAITAALLFVATCVLAVNGVYLQRHIGRSFETTELIRVARTHAFKALEDQLNEETGLRGYTATHESLFLEPYDNGHARIADSLGVLQQTLTALGPDTGVSDVEDARRTNVAWLSTVAASRKARVAPR